MSRSVIFAMKRSTWLIQVALAGVKPPPPLAHSGAINV